jgi:cell division septal protein FtsQ
MLKEIFIIIFDLSGIVSLILVIIFWFFIWPKFTKEVDLLSNIILNPEKEILRKELIEQCEETANLNLEVCDEFKYVDGEN